MKRFRFSLENLLNLRHSVERQNAINLAKAVQTASSIEEKINFCEMQKEMAFQMDASSLEQMRFRENLWQGAVSKIKNMEKDREFSLNQVGEAQKKYNEAHRNKEILERLKLRRKSEWQNRWLKNEEKKLEELNTHAFSSSGKQRS